MSASQADTILRGGKIYQVDEEFRTAEAVAIKHGSIVFVGRERELSDWIGKETHVVDLEGRVVVPGFMDSHLHPVYSGKNFDQVQLAGSKSIREVLDRIASHAKDVGAGEWFRGSNHWSIDELEDRRLPYKHELDEVTPHNPFWVNVAFHRATANSAALKAGGIDRNTPVQFGGGTGYVFKDPQSGEPTGHLLESAMFCVMQQQPLESDADVLRGIRTVQDRLVAEGITSVIDQGDVGPPFRNFRLMQRLWQQGHLKLRWRMNHIGFEMLDMDLKRIPEHIASLRVVSGFGDDWLRMGAVGELVLDGFVEDHWAREPYAEAAFEEGWRGILLFEPDRVLAICKAAAQNGLQMNVHCSGDGALDIALDAFRRVNDEISIRGLQWTLEHGGLHPTEDNLKACGDMGVVVSTQQPLQYWHSGDIIKFYGAKATEYFPNRTWYEHGVMLRGGSDFDTAPLSPIFGIWTIVSRRNILGERLAPEQSVPRDVALRMYTINGAKSVFEDDRRGSVEVGKLADLVILSEDLMEIPEDDLLKVEVVATMVGGRFVYDAAGLS